MYVKSLNYVKLNARNNGQTNSYKGGSGDFEDEAPF